MTGDRRCLDFRAGVLGGTTFLNARSNVLASASAPISRAILMKRFDCAGSSGGGLGLRAIRSIVAKRWNRGTLFKFWPSGPNTTVPIKRVRNILDGPTPNFIPHSDLQRFTSKPQFRQRGSRTLLTKTEEAKPSILEGHKKRSIARICHRPTVWDDGIYCTRGDRYGKSHEPFVSVECCAFHVTDENNIRHIENRSFIFDFEIGRSQ